MRSIPRESTSASPSPEAPDGPDIVLVGDERALLARLRAGDEAAFNALVRAHVEALCTYAALVTKSDETAEEIVQDVFFEVWRRHRQLVIATSLRHYLYGAVRNRAINVLRQAKRRATFADAMSHETLVAAGGMDMLDAEATVYAVEIDEAMRRAIDLLPSRTRAAYLYRAEGLSYADIARRLGVAVKTVEAQVGGAIKTLRKRLARFR